MTLNRSCDTAAIYKAALDRTSVLTSSRAILDPMTTPPRNPVCWFQIPVDDLDRATRFYERVFACTLTRVNGDGGTMALFPSDANAPGVSGCLVKHPKSRPSAEGTLVHFSSPSDDLSRELAIAQEAGGKVLQGKTSIGENGFFALIEDTEGNVIGVHSMR